MYLYKMVYLLDSSFITLSIKALVLVLREIQFDTLVNQLLEHNVRSTKKPNYHTFLAVGFQKETQLHLKMTKQCHLGLMYTSRDHQASSVTKLE